MGYSRLSKKLPANVFSEQVRKNGKATIQVMDMFDREYYKIWESAVLHNDCEIESVAHSIKPWVYITFVYSPKRRLLKVEGKDNIVTS